MMYSLRCPCILEMTDCVVDVLRRRSQDAQAALESL
jgi:hypothetical protein